MSYAVESFTEVKDHHVSLCLFVEGCSQFVIECEDLGFTAPLGPKSMLAVVENVMFLQVFYHVTHNDMFKKLTTQTCEVDWSIVGSIMTGTLFIYSCHVGMSQVIWHGAFL